MAQAAVETVECNCCGRTLPRAKVHALGEPASYICRRCGAWVAVLWRGDPTDRA